MGFVAVHQLGEHDVAVGLDHDSGDLFVEGTDGLPDGLAVFLLEAGVTGTEAHLVHGVGVSAVTTAAPVREELDPVLEVFSCPEALFAVYMVLILVATVETLEGEFLGAVGLFGTVADGLAADALFEQTVAGLFQLQVLQHVLDTGLA